MQRRPLLILLCVVASGCVTAREPAAQTSPGRILADRDLLFTARRARFAYLDHLRRAETGDLAALLALIELTPRISWSAAGYEEHGDVLLALHGRLGADAFRGVFLRASPEARSQVTIAMYAMSGYQQPLHLTAP